MLTLTQHSYFVVPIEYKSGREAIVDLEMTRRGAVETAYEAIGDGNGIAFVHHVHDGICEDITQDILEEVRDQIFAKAEALSTNERDFIELNFGCRAALDHARELV